MCQCETVRSPAHAESLYLLALLVDRSVRRITYHALLIKQIDLAFLSITLLAVCLSPRGFPRLLGIGLVEVNLDVWL